MTPGSSTMLDRLAVLTFVVGATVVFLSTSLGVVVVVVSLGTTEVPRWTKANNVSFYRSKSNSLRFIFG